MDAAAQPAADDVRRRLDRHLRAWLGTWPPDAPVTIAAAASRAGPDWDGAVRPLAGVVTPDGAVISVPPGRLAAARAAAEGAASLDQVLEGLPQALGQPGAQVGRGVFRYALEAPDLDGAGEWVAASDHRVPAWLRPFGGEVLVVLDGDRYVAGLGVKRLGRLGREVAVATEEAWRGRGLARALVARATRRILAEGRVPIYLHGPANEGSARVAEAAGFPDRGWSVIGLPTAS